jgi:hypothetical protein
VFFCLNSTLTIVYVVDDYVKGLFSKMGKILCNGCNAFLSMGALGKLKEEIIDIRKKDGNFCFGS